MKRKMLKMAYLILSTTLLTTLSLLYYISMPIQASNVVYVPKGSINEIITYLGRKGFDVGALDSFLVRLFGKPQHGWVDIGSEHLSRGDFLYRLTTAKAALADVTLIPGETTFVFFQTLSGRMGLSFERLMEEFSAISPLPEGIIIPDTYKIPLGISERHLVYYLVSSSLARHEELSRKIFGEYDKARWFRYLVVASIIQKEAADNEEMPLVAAVIYNRLKINMPLQMDGALNYKEYSHIRVTKKRILEDASSYNTYKHQGLPKHPVCNVGLEAIRAAIYPAKADYIYFVKSKDGKHRFSTSYRSHLKNIKDVNK